MAAAPPLPIAATVAVSRYTRHKSWSTGLTGHSDPQVPREKKRKYKGKDKGKKERPSPRPPKGKTTEGYILGRAWAPLLSALFFPVLRRDPPRANASHPCGAQEFQHRVRRLSLPQVSHRRGPRPIPPQGLPDILPQPPRLRSPCRAPRKEMMPRLGLSAGAPPALCRV